MTESAGEQTSSIQAFFQGKWVWGAAIVLGGLGLAFGIFALWRYANPIESTEFLQRLELRRDYGVRQGTLAEGRIAYLEKNLCGERLPARKDVPAQQAALAFGCQCVVLIHGVGDNALTWRKLFQAEVESWAGPIRLFAVDLPGSGNSPLPADPRDYAARKQAALLKTALSEIKDCKQWNIVGNSFGGWVASWLAMDWMDKTLKLALLGATGLKVQAEKKRPYLSEPGVAGLKEFQRLAYFKPRELPEKVWQAAAEKMARSNVRELLANQVPEDYLDTYLPSFKKFTLVYWGKHDGITPPEEGRALAALLPLKIYREAPSCGHLPQKECPAPLLTALNEILIAGGM